MLTSLLFIALGIGFLYLGAEGLVRGSSSLALRLKITPLVIGLTVVAYGTSTPELVVSIQTALNNQGAISVGNVVGSNIFNIALILGLSAIICPMKVKWQLVKMDTPIMIAVAALFWFIFLDFHIGRLEGLVLFLAVVVYTIVNFWLSKKGDTKEIEAEFTDGISKPLRNIWLDLLYIVGGLAILVLGSRLFVTGSVKFAQLMGVSEAIIGLTIIAAGTSLPELATSLVASIRKQADIAIGNIVGSNIYNILCILGVASLIAPIDGTGISMIDVYVMIATSVLLWPMLWTSLTLKRSEGVVLVLIYAGYLSYLFLQLR